MWACDTCDKTFSNPNAAYSEGERVIFSDNEEEFSSFVWAHEDGWYCCPYCGSDLIISLDENEH